MSIYAKNKLMSNCKVGSNQVSKITLGSTTIWENWTGPYSASKEDPNTGEYRANAGVSWSFSKPGIKLIYAHSEGHSSHEEYGRARIYITTSDGKYSNTTISQGSAGVDAGTTWNGTIENVTFVGCSLEGTVNNKNCVGTIRYYKRGS
jgi:hypothetical protein